MGRLEPDGTRRQRARQIIHESAPEQGHEEACAHGAYCARPMQQRHQAEQTRKSERERCMRQSQQREGEQAAGKASSTFVIIFKLTNITLTLEQAYQHIHDVHILLMI